MIVFVQRELEGSNAETWVRQFNLCWLPAEKQALKVKHVVSQKKQKFRSETGQTQVGSAQLAEGQVLRPISESVQFAHGTRVRQAELVT